MKILYDYQIFGSQSYGGISRYFCETFRRISANPEHQVNILAPFFINQYLRNTNRGVIGNYIPRIPKTGRLIQRMNIMISRIMMKRFKHIDIYHETYYSDVNLAPPGSARVITVYDMIHEKFQDSFPTADKTTKIKKKAISRSDHIICISENTRKDLLEFYDVDVDHTSVVHLGHSLMNGHVTPNNPYLLSKPFILFVGARAGYKNFENLIKAYSSSCLLRTEFNLVCFGSGSFTSREIRFINELGLSQTSVIHIAGGDEILRSLYSAASVFVYPSLYEGFGIPPLEAMAHGCPVVCSNTSSLPEVVGNAALTFNPEDQVEIAKSIENAVSSNNLRQRLIREGRQQSSKFTWEKCAQETLDVYDRLV